MVSLGCDVRITSKVREDVSKNVQQLVESINVSLRSPSLSCRVALTASMLDTRAVFRRVLPGPVGLPVADRDHHLESRHDCGRL